MWKWLVIGTLLLYVVVLLWSAWDEYRSQRRPWE